MFASLTTGFPSVDEGPPVLLMEDDHVIELEIVRPLVDDFVSDAVARSTVNDLQRLVEMQMEEVAVETEAKKLVDMMESILFSCLSQAVDITEMKRGK
jgi:hypothetical protein